MERLRQFQWSELLQKKKLLFTLGMFAMLILVYFANRKNDFTFYLAIPAIIIVVMAIENFRNLWYILIFCLPLSIHLRQFIPAFPGADLTFPSDVLCIGLGLLMIFKMASERRTFGGLYWHPITFVIGIMLLWQLFPVITSTMLEVSIKNYIAALWLILGFFFLSTWVFSNPKRIVHFFWLIGAGFALALIIILIKYGFQGRNPFGQLRFNPTPVFHDHTIFGAFPPFYIPIFVLFIFQGKFRQQFRIVSGLMLLFLIGGLFFSYSRGAWGSTFLSLAIMFLVIYRNLIQKYLIPFLAVSMIVGYFGLGMLTGIGNSKDAVSRKSFADHIVSISNFQTDYSNTERINRWTAAWDMFEKKPITGFGPGTYAFKYAPFQRSKYRTPVSTNRGDNGTAHNEFLLAMSEGGLVSGLIMMALFLVPLIMGLRGYLKTSLPNLQVLYLGVTFGLLTYFFHSWVNNFLDQDKIGGTYFAFLAMIVALDRYQNRIRSDKA